MVVCGRALLGVLQQLDTSLKGDICCFRRLSQKKKKNVVRKGLMANAGPPYFTLSPFYHPPHTPMLFSSWGSQLKRNFPLGGKGRSH